jgi:hypothetical protein
MCRCFPLFLFKSILLFAAASIPSRQAPQTNYPIPAHLWNSSMRLLLRNDGFNFFNIVGRPDSVYLQLEGVVHFRLVLVVVNLLS